MILSNVLNLRRQFIDLFNDGKIDKEILHSLAIELNEIEDAITTIKNERDIFI